VPFEHQGAPEDAYFASGLTREIVSRLAAVRGLGFVSGNGDPTEDSAENADEKGRALGVDFVLDGAVRWDRGADIGRQLVVDSRLLRVSDRVEVWSQQFVRPMSDVFLVQSVISRAVADQMGVALSPRETMALDARPTDHLEAYHAYLRGLELSSSFEERELALAEQFFDQAVTLDPNFAKAHAALSENHSLIFHWRYDRAPQRLAASNAAAHRAREIDQDLPESHRALGYYYYWGQRNFELALSEFSLAAQGRPNDPTIFGSIGVVLRRQGRWDEALDALQRAAEMEPENASSALDLASTLARMRRYAEAVDQCHRAIELAPNAIYPYVFLARILRARNGAIAEAREALEAMPEKDPAQQSFYLYEQAMYERDFEGAIDELATVGDVIREPIDELIITRSLAECETRVLAGTAIATVQSCASAVDYLERARDDSPADPGIHAALGWAYALIGNADDAITAGERAVELSPVTTDAMVGHTYLVRLAKIYAWADEPFLAVKILHTALSTPGWISVETLKLDPEWDPIREDPRFQELLKMHAIVEQYPLNRM
jgi:serine/threonine-protein kinase